MVVTGAAAGQGLAEAKALFTAGARVVAVDLAATPSVELLTIMEPDQGRGQCHYVSADVSSPEGWVRVAELAASQDGAVHGLVNNAGITRRPRLLAASLEDLRTVHEINVAGALLGIQALVPHMGPGASIINVGSVAALTAHYPVAYTASKWALRGLTDVAALELGPSGIRVNAVHPGFIETSMTSLASPAFRAATIAETPLGRTGSAQEVAAVVLFLLSPLSSYVSGAHIPVDGGQSSHGGAKSVSDALR